MLSAVGILTMFLPSVHASEASAKDVGWPQWRGPHRDGTVASTPAWPSSLGEEFFQRTWRIDLGPGYSGPLVTGGLVVTTETEGKATEVVRALKLETGEEVWRTSWEGALTVPFFAKSNGDWIRSTPATDGSG